MSHEITKKDSLFYAGEEPWHGIGTKVEDLLTASEALVNAGLTWEVVKEPIFDKQGQEIEDFKAIKRADTGDIFQIVTNRYEPVQNADCFKVFDEVTKTGQAKYEVAGSLQSGRKVWILARLPYDFALAGGRDEVRSYLLLTTSHDGSLAFQMYQTPIRVVCYNTLRASLSIKEKGKVAYFKHTVNFRNRVGRAGDILAEAKEYYVRFKEASEVLVRKQVQEIELKDFTARLFDTVNKKPEDVKTRTKNAIQDVERLFVEGKGNDIPGVAGSAWALYNGVTQYVDHERSTRGDDSNRLASSWYGSGADLRERAFALLTK